MNEMNDNVIIVIQLLYNKIFKLVEIWFSSNIDHPNLKKKYTSKLQNIFFFEVASTVEDPHFKDFFSMLSLKNVLQWWKVCKKVVDNWFFTVWNIQLSYLTIFVYVNKDTMLKSGQNICKIFFSILMFFY